MKVESEPVAARSQGVRTGREISGTFHHRGVREAIDRAVQCLLGLQSPDGYWAGELEADTTLESDYILYQLWMHPPDAGGSWRPPAEKVAEAARYIRERQTATGGWSIYPGGPDEISASVKGYFALKLAGDGPDDPHMQAASRRILDLGGIERANSFTRIYLSFFGLWPRDQVPTIPPELILLSASAHFNIYEMSSWSRAILVPLSIICAHHPCKAVPAGFHLDELRSGAQPVLPRPWSCAAALWKLDGLFKAWERSGFLPHRQQAIRAAAKWMIERMETSEGLAAIYPSMLNSIFALMELGYPLDHPLLARAIDQFEGLAIRQNGTMRMQPCVSPVWDTAIAAFALGRASDDHPVRAALSHTADWLLSKEVRSTGDWAVKNRGVEPGGWYFEFANEFYPDVDDTAMVLLALNHCRASNLPAQRASERRAVDWMVSMQGKDGGWAAFDKDNDRWILTQVPFADHNAMLDPSCADITGRVIEALSSSSLAGSEHQAVRRGVQYLRRTQEPDGSWSGRWGVNYIYGTCFALRGLRAAGVHPRDACLVQAAEWIRSFQNPDGGWGETCGSYDDPDLKGIGPTTPSQTAWALLGLFASGDYSSSSVERGIKYLLETQNARGRWEDPFFTGTGFPRVFYLKYHLYAHYFPLMALAEYVHQSARDYA